MTARHTFATWAPPESPWSPWAKPVLFTELDYTHGAPSVVLPEMSHDMFAWLKPLHRRTAIVLDLPGEAAVAGGLQLTRRGYRPVPLFNTSSASNAVVSVTAIVAGLKAGEAILEKAALPADAPPAFLLDANRLPTTTRARPGMYDNRWVVLPQDFPSAAVLRRHHIDTVVLWQRANVAPANDLAHILRRWQEAGLTLLTKCGEPDQPPSPLNVPRPSLFRSVLHRLAVLSGLRRNFAGGFGSTVPEPSQRRGYG